jgi:two-component system, cell cycle sensor histidine kinase and response regulator CckA
LITLPGESLWTVKVDPGQIEQVLTNLVVNARDAMPEGGKLTIETQNVVLDESYSNDHPDTDTGEYVMLAVSDTGIGMDKETLSHLFEPFFTTKPKGSGTGLGLSTCYGIVKQNNGGIWVYSEPGKGTTVKVYFPKIEDINPQQENVYSHETILEGTETVLVAEDDAGIRTMITRHLTAAGYRVLSASNGDEALSLVNKTGESIHLLITDVIMPLMGGKALADRLTVIYPGLRILFMSGYTDNSIVHHGVLETGIKFIQKPFSMVEFMRKIREVLEQ